MALFMGMSGWAYSEWRGAFYPAAARGDRMLAYYAQHFASVEVNNTFYRLPSPETVAGWCDLVPETFRFSFKAPGAITHRKRFGTPSDYLDRFAGLLTVVKSRLGPVLFQLDTVADVEQLREFASHVRPRFERIAFEFRHASWYDEAVFDILRASDIALCQTETDDACDPPLGAREFSYVRLRKSAYSGDELAERVARLEALTAGGRDVFGYLKHDVENAVLLRDLAATPPAG